MLKCANLRLLFVGSAAESNLTSLVAVGGYVVASHGHYLSAWHRGRRIYRHDVPGGGHIKRLLSVGQVVIGVTRDNQLVLHRDIFDAELGIVASTQSAVPDLVDVTCLVHPHTYLNKIVLGCSDGILRLWNFWSEKSIFESKPFKSAISALTSSPALDTIGVGLVDGTIIVYNILADTEVMEFRQTDTVLSMSFRTDSYPFLATSNETGDISFWDLDKQRLATVQKMAHTAAVSSISFLPSQPVLMSTGTDNALKEWIFDSLDGEPRILRFRQGHALPPRLVRFYGENAQYILSSADDKSFFAFSSYNDAQTAEMSQTAVIHATKTSNKTPIPSSSKRLNPVISIAFNTAREGEWESMITAHQDDRVARTWLWPAKRLGKHLLPTKDGTAAKVVGASKCGNFGFVGSLSGNIDMYNLQSGIHRRKFKPLHSSTSYSVTGVYTNDQSTFLYGTLIDGTVLSWKISSGELTNSINVGSPITNARFQSSSDLLAVSCDDLSLKVVDVSTFVVIRTYEGHYNQITDFTFSPDGHWLVSASLDHTIRSWDLPTGYMIDAIKLETACVSLDFAPNGEYLATANLDSIGVGLWTNRAFFSSVDLRKLTEADVVDVTAPQVSREGNVDFLAAVLEQPDNTNGNSIQRSFETPEQLADNLVTLSIVPKTQWKTLLRLDDIRLRNKAFLPKQPMQKAPFFLDNDNLNEKTLKKPQIAAVPRGFDMMDIQLRNKFNQLLLSFVNTSDSTSFVEFLKTLSPNDIDLEIRSLLIIPPYEELIAFVFALTDRLSTKRDFELLQAWMAVFLKVHSDTIIGAEKDDRKQLLDAISVWNTKHAETIDRIKGLHGYCQGVLNFLQQ